MSQRYPAAPNRFFGTRIAADASNLFFTTFNDGPARLHKTDLNGSNDASIVLEANGQVAIDADSVYWTVIYKTAAEKGGIYRASKQALGVPKRIAATDNTYAIATGGGSLCFSTLDWAAAAPLSVYVADTDGNTKLVANGQVGVSHVLIDDGYCYWTSSSALSRRKLDLSAPTEVLATDPTHRLGGIATDASFVYFTAGSAGEIRRVHK